MKRMLFNATQAEELRVAIVDGQKLIDLDIESARKQQSKSNIYKAVITRIEPSLEAAFVDYGGNRHGFLPFKEVAPQYYLNQGSGGRPNIKDALKEGQELLVQIEKDERGNKGAALTTYISLAGRYIVLMPNNPHGGGVSRRIEGEDRSELRDVLAQLDVPKGASIIARTAGIGRSSEELQWDLNYLTQLWEAIESAANSEKAPSLIYLESSLVVRAIRDYFHPEIGEILIDTDEIYQQALAFMSTVMPDNVNRIKRYTDDIPLFSRFQIEHQIESAHAREVSLPSGGVIVIDHTEALTAIDINSARSTRGTDIETTAFNTNLEAADEIARQIRLRDLGGLIVIDFIDMESNKNQREVENRLRDALRYDRARVQTAKISRFGLLELSRQRLQPSLEETSYSPCPRCNGIGHIRGTESTALHILRIIQEEAMKDNSNSVHVQVPVDVATFLLNEKRRDVNLIESRLKVNVVIMPNPHMDTPNYSITRLRHDDISAENQQTSYKMVEKPAETTAPTATQSVKVQRPQAAVQGITPQQPAPKHVEAKQPSLLDRFFAWLGSIGGEETPKKAAPAARPHGRSERSEGGRQDGKRNKNRRERERDRDDTQRSERNAQQENRQQEQRKEKQQAQQQRQPRPAPEKSALESAVPAPRADGAEGSQDGNGRKRGRRGGRRERERREQQQMAEQAANNQQLDHDVSLDLSGHEAGSATPAAVAVADDQLVQVETRADAPAQASSAPAPAYPNRRRARPREIYTMENRGEQLVQVETSQAPAASAAIATPAPAETPASVTASAAVEVVTQVESPAPASHAAAEEEAPAHHAAPVLVEEPLIQVETHKTVEAIAAKAPAPAIEETAAPVEVNAEKAVITAEVKAAEPPLQEAEGDATRPYPLTAETQTAKDAETRTDQPA